MKVEYSDAFFEISAYASGTSITLQDWTGAVVAAGETYEIFKTVYAVSSSFGEVWDVAYKTKLPKKSQSYFNRVDPSRTSTGADPVFWAFAGLSSTGVLQIEIYPIPTGVVPLRVYGKQKITTLGVSDTALLPEDLIEAFALIDCYRIKDTIQPGQGWGDRVGGQVDRYQDLLSSAMEEDELLDSHNMKVRDAMEESSFPEDDTFAASHDLGD